MLAGSQAFALSTQFKGHTKSQSNFLERHLICRGKEELVHSGSQGQCPIFFSSSLREVAEAYLPEIEHKDRKDDRETTARFRLTEMALLQTEVHQAPS